AGRRDAVGFTEKQLAEPKREALFPHTTRSLKEKRRRQRPAAERICQTRTQVGVSKEWDDGSGGGHRLNDSRSFGVQLKAFSIEETSDDFCERRLVLAHYSQRDVGGLRFGKAVHAGRNCRECNGVNVG